MNKFDSYKETEIKWIGKIPSDWKVSKVGKFFNERNEKVDDVTYPPLSVTMSGIVDQLSEVAKTNDGENRKLVKKNDFVINSRSDRKGSSGIAPRDGSVSLINIVLEPHGLDPHFIQHLFKSYYFKEEYFRNGKGIHWDLWTTRWDQFKNINIPIPTIQEQKLISRYLNKKTEQIDRLVEKIKKKIELLKEQWTSLINQCVTKGLDLNVEMKDSGVEWIGEIPKHWDVKKGKYILSIFSSVSTDEEIDGEGVPLIKVDDLNEVSNGYYLVKSKAFVALDIKNKPLPIGSVIFPKRGMTILTNKVVISQIEGLLDPNLMGVKVHKNINSKFIFHLIKNRGLGDICDKTTIPQINNKHIYPLEFQIPPLEEQNSIVDSIDRKSIHFEKIITKEVTRINLLREYRQSLISSVVTGKVRITKNMI